MKVRNREGHSLDVSYDEIKRRITRLCDDDELANVDIDKIVIQTINGIYDGITTGELDELSARICASLQSVHYAYDELAAKITVSNRAKCIRRRLEEMGLPNTSSGKVRYVETSSPRTYDDAFYRFVTRHADALDKMVVYSRDVSHSYFALRTMERSYLLRVGDDACVESPQDMWMRVSVGINVGLKRRRAQEGEGDDDVRVLADIANCYDSLSTGLFTHATPTLFNAGLRYQQCSSCYLLGTEDSLSGIFKTISDSAQISKWAGGIGIHVSNVRAKGSKIRSTNGTSDGIIPMLKVYNEMARYCNHAGRRKGSLAAYLEPWHADVWEFVELRRNTGAETERARDLFIALWVPDEFMKRLEADDDWYLMSPDQSPGLIDAVGDEFSHIYKRHIEAGNYVRKLRTRTLWQHIINCQLETGTPYVLYKDHVNRKSNHMNIGTVRSSNLCAEVVEYSDSTLYAVCNLASIAVNRFVVDGAVDHAALHAAAKVLTRNLDRIIDLNTYPTSETQVSNPSTRPIGIGIQGMGDVYCMLRLPYEDARAIALDAEVMETIYHGALEASVELAEDEARGPYDWFQGSPLSRGLFQFNLWGVDDASLSGRYDWGAMRLRVAESGVRNSMLTALMPTASTSQILGNCECFEPFQSNVFKRSTLAGEFMVVNKHLMRDLMRLGKWNDAMRKALLVNDGSVQSIADVPDEIKAVYKTVWEIPLRSIIDHAVARGPFVCQSQSMNLFMAKPSFQKLSSALIYGWRKGLKTGMYYLRSAAAVEAIKYGVAASRDAADDDADAAQSAAPACSLGGAGGGGGAQCDVCSA